MSRWWSFEFYSSLTFWAVLVAVAVLVRARGWSARARGWILFASSSALLLAIPRFTGRDLVLVWSFSAVTLAVARYLVRGDVPGSPTRRRLLAALGILAVLGFLSFFKYRFVREVLRGPSDALFLIGASYFSFKAIHVIVEAYKRSIPSVEPLTYLNYITFFPSFISGPISRYAQFAAELGAERRGTLRADLAAGGERIVHGLFKKFVLVPIVFPWATALQSRPLAQTSFLEAASLLYAFALYTYFDFSGYSDLAIGGARVIGVGLPENFNHPFLQKNIRDLWSNWHMSLTTWLVEYIYWPIVRRLRNIEYFRARPVLLSIVGMNATFLACGVWHGSTLNFVLWGAYHGLGISAVNVYQRQKKRIRSRRVQRYFQSRASRAVGAFLTFNFFAVGLLLFVYDMRKLRALLAAFVR